MSNPKRRLDWMKLLNGKRRKAPSAPSPQKGIEHRIPLERDYDRLLFSTPVRRLADKTQVFPLERNDSIRTRLTHSHEVANLARSIGTTLVYDHGEELGLTDTSNAHRAIPSLLGSIGLAHDLGNPPFGHQGEDAMQSWIAKHSAPSNEQKQSFDIFANSGLSVAERRDFEKFEGNAQALRLLTRLQLINDDFGLNMSYAFLAALMKYPVPSDKIDKTVASRKKFNFFQSEARIVEDVWQQTGLTEGVRHPLTLIMEACDDIAYSVLDLEDAAKKGLISFHDLIASLNHDAAGDPQMQDICQQSCSRENDYRRSQLSGAELSDISMQMLRVQAIGLMVNAVTDAFIKNRDTILAGEFHGELLAVSSSNALWKALKSFAKKHVYSHRSVIEVELDGHRTIHALMDAFWQAIRHRGSNDFITTKDAPPYHAYVYSRISENYRRAAEMSKMPMRYRELQLMTDMISGMTDSFAVDLCRKLTSLKG